MKKVVIVPNKVKDAELSVTSKVIEKLSIYGIEAYIDEKNAALINCSAVTVYKHFPKDAELIIVVGGDGSIIDASSLAVRWNLPIVGVNLGKIGYLSEIDPYSLDVLKRLKDGDFYIEEKLLLSIEGIEDRYAVNDVVISHESELGIGDFRIEDKNGNSIKYRADGIILATPQGSTAYSLSAGGPIVAHDVDTILLSAVAPHSFFNRSVLFNASDVLKITNLGNDELNVSIDGRLVAHLNANEVCTVSKAHVKVKILTFTKNSMFSNLFNKMQLLEDMH